MRHTVIHHSLLHYDLIIPDRGEESNTAQAWGPHVSRVTCHVAAVSPDTGHQEYNLHSISLRPALQLMVRPRVVRTGVSGCDLWIQHLTNFTSSLNLTQKRKRPLCPHFQGESNHCTFLCLGLWLQIEETRLCMLADGGMLPCSRWSGHCTACSSAGHLPSSHPSHTLNTEHYLAAPGHAII